MKAKLSFASLLIFALSGCVNKPQQQTEITPLPDSPTTTLSSNVLTPLPIQPEARVVSQDIYQQNNPSSTEVIRDGRYTLVSIAPEDGQKFLLEQVVTVKVPQKNKKYFTATVEQGLRSTLQNTGLDLCYPSGINTDSNIHTLFSRPLPKVHYQFGPMKLYEALEMISGPAYEMTLNDISRTICFQTRATPAKHQAKPIEIISTTTKTEIIEDN